MTAAALTPRVRMMAICDRIRKSQTETDVYHLKGVRHAITAHAFPFVPKRLWLFLVLSSPQPGEFAGYLRVVNDQSGRTIYYSYLQPRPTFEVEGRAYYCRASIRCVFPEEGQYTVQVWFFQKQGHDVLKGEIPFHVAFGA